MSIQAIEKELLRRIAKGEGYCEIVMKKSSKHLWIYQQDISRCFAVYFTDGNIWKDEKKPIVFRYQDGGIKKLAEYIMNIA